jgi:hypothetical protein
MERAVHPQELFTSVLARSRALGPPPAGDAALERYRADCTEWVARVPEPPLYRRAQDPSRARAAALLPDGEGLLARGWALLQAGVASAADTTLTQALEAHLESLCLVTEGQLERAEAAWARASALERKARAARRTFVREEEVELPVWDAGTGASRFDPRPAPSLRVRLACPQWACRRAEEIQLSPTYAIHRRTCLRCGQPYVAYLAEARELSVERTPGGRRYGFRVEALGGGLSRVEFDDDGTDLLAVVRGDLLAFLYTAERELRGVTNMSTGRTLWVTRSGPCYLATHVYGESAPELFYFRAFRDRVLVQSAPGRCLVRAYYRGAPVLVRWLPRHPVADRLLRQLVHLLARLLKSVDALERAR